MITEDQFLLQELREFKTGGDAHECNRLEGLYRRAVACQRGPDVTEYEGQIWRFIHAQRRWKAAREAGCRHPNLSGIRHVMNIEFRSCPDCGWSG